MTGIVAVSHSPALARAAVDLALEMGGAHPPAIRIAAGGPDGSTGTDAIAIAAAIDAVADDGGVLVVTDLGSAILSARLALELVTTGARVRLSAAPFVEGLVAAVVAAASGAGVDDVDRQTLAALDAKRSQRGGEGTGASAEAASASAEASFDVVVSNPSGLHARPAATFARTAARYDADVQVTDLDAGGAPASASSLVALMALDVRQGTRVRVQASGPQAADALDALRALLDEGFGEL